MQRYAFPFEGQPGQLRFGEDAAGTDAVQDRVKQHRMQTELASVGPRLLRQRRLDEHLGATAPHRAQAAESRAVFVSTRGQHRVGLGNVDRFRPLRRPLAELLSGGGVWVRGEYAFGMAPPRPVPTIVVVPRVDPDWTFATLILSAHTHFTSSPTLAPD